VVHGLGTKADDAMTDRELLDLAAKAAGIERGADRMDGGVSLTENGRHRSLPQWNPLTDDGDALRLAVKLRFHVNIFAADSSEGMQTPGFIEIWGKDIDLLRVEWVEGNDYERATRRAIVRAAAEIGKTK
jgi:hypothetical protein